MLKFKKIRFLRQFGLILIQKGIVDRKVIIGDNSDYCEMETSLAIAKRISIFAHLDVLVGSTWEHVKSGDIPRLEVVWDMVAEKEAPVIEEPVVVEEIEVVEVQEEVVEPEVVEEVPEVQEEQVEEEVSEVVEAEEVVEQDGPNVVQVTPEHVAQKVTPKRKKKK